MEKCGAQNAAKPPEKSKIYGLAEVSEKSKARQADAKKAKRSEGNCVHPAKTVADKR